MLFVVHFNRIGYAIAKRLGEEGASVVISSRKEENVKQATASLRNDGINAEGLVCHVGNSEQRKKLFDFVSNFYVYLTTRIFCIYVCTCI